MLIFTLFFAVEALRHAPFSRPISFPPLRSGNQPEIDGSPGHGVSTFPVVNIRFAYPPTSVDVRRTKSLALSQAFLIDQATKLSAIIESDTDSLTKNINMQSMIVKALTNARSDKFTKNQKKWLKFYAQYFPEVPAGSFLEQHPQINIGVEDNTAEFAQGPEMNPKQAIKFVVSMSEVWMSDRRLIIELLKSYMKRISIINEFLSPSIIAARATSFIETDDKKSQGSTVSKPSSEKRAADGNSQTPLSVKKSPDADGHDIPVDMALMVALRGRVMQGGRPGAAAIAGLIDLWNEQFGFRQLIRDSHVLADCKLLMSLPKTPDYIKNLAGTLITLVSGIPVATSSADLKSGSYGHVNVVIPRPSRTYLADKQIAFAEGG